MKTKNIYRIIEYIILAGMAVFLLANASAQSFWSDEISTLGYIHSGTTVFDMMKGYMVTDAVNLPLYPLILYIVYRIVPYGEVYLLLPSIIFTISSLWVIGSIGYMCGNEDTELYAVGLGSVSYWLICRGAWDIRCYSLLVLLSATTIYFYMRRTKEETNKNIIGYGISMLLLFYTHWFGALMMVFFALYDLFLYIRKKVAFKCIISYLFAGGLFLPWCIAMLATTTRDLLGNNAASSSPTIESIKALLMYLSGDSFLCMLILCWGIIVVVISCWHYRKNDKNFYLPLIGSCIWVIGLVYAYCAYLNPNGSFFENKYFLVLLPQTLSIMSFGLSQTKCQILSFTSKKRKQLLKVTEVLIILATAIIYGRLVWCNYNECYEFAHEIRMPYRQCAEYLVETGEIYDDDVLVVSAETSTLTEGWYDYYFRKKGNDLPSNSYVLHVNCDCGTLKEWNPTEEADVLNKYKKIILVSLSLSVSEEFQKFVDENYILIDNIYTDSIKEYKCGE